MTLLGRAIFAWLIADGDFHLKNMGMLKVAPEGAKSFASVRFAPVYDTVTTRVFPGLANDQMALALAGKRDQLTSGDFVKAGATMGLSAATVRECVESICRRLSAHIKGQNSASGRVNQTMEIWINRIDSTAKSQSKQG